MTQRTKKPITSKQKKILFIGIGAVLVIAIIAGIIGNSISGPLLKDLAVNTERLKEQSFPVDQVAAEKIGVKPVDGHTLIYKANANGSHFCLQVSSGSLSYYNTQDSNEPSRGTCDDYINALNPDGHEYLVTTYGAKGFKDTSKDKDKYLNSWLDKPNGVAVDEAGNIYVANTFRQQVHKITPDYKETILVSGDVKSALKHPILSGGGGGDSFTYPDGLAVYKDKLYIANSNQSEVRYIKTDDSEDISLELAGNRNGNTDGGSSTAQFNQPNDIAIDTNGNIYVADTFNNSIRKITLTKNGGAQVSTLATALNRPKGIDVSSDGTVYIADSGNNRIVTLSPSGGMAVFAEGFNNPSDVAVDLVGNVYVADTTNHAIKRLTRDATVSFSIGSESGYKDGGNKMAKFNAPASIVLNANGDVFVADTENNALRKIAPAW